MPAPASHAARDAFDRLLLRCAVGLRSGCALAFGLAAFGGRSEPVSARPVALAVGGLALWAAVSARPALGGRWRSGVFAGDLLVAGAVSVGHGWLVPPAVLAGTTSGVFLVASTVVIVSQLGPRPWPGVLATVVVPVAYATGLAIASGADPPGGAVLLVVQGALLGGLMVPLRRAAAGADRAIDERDAVERDAAVRAARRAEEREHNRLLHDSVSATLTVVAAGGVARTSGTLRRQAARDLEVIERIQQPAGPAGGDRLDRRLGPVVAAADPGLALRAEIAALAVPAPVGAAIGGAVAEALTNVARHAGGSRVGLSARRQAGGVVVELVDDGPGFDPAGVPPSRRGVRESLVGRMRSVGGAAAVTSVPGGGTRVLLSWPAPDAADPAQDRPPLGELVARSYGRGMVLVVLWLVAVWHLTNDLLGLVSWSASYRSLGAEVAGWLGLAAVGVLGGVRLLRQRTGRGPALALAGATLAAGGLATAAVPGPALLGGAGWAWGATGWFGVLVLLRRPPVELVALLLANSGVTLAVLAYDGVLDRVGVARFGTVLYGTAALQLTVALTARALDATGRRAAAVAGAAAAVRRRRQVAEELHAGRQERYRDLRRSAGPLLAGLAAGTLDPAERDTRHRCAVAASRLRRLFAETDDVPDSLLHELRACADIADRRGVLVDLQVLGRLPELDRTARRTLTEAPLVALAGAERNARVTVVGRSDEVAVSVLADGDEDGWVEARWRRR